MLRHLLLLLLLPLLLIGCGEKKESTGEDAAVAFFKAVYVDSDLNAARALAGPQLRTIIDSYGSISGIRRNLVALYLDNAEVTASDTTEDFLRKVATEAVVQIHLKGLAENGGVREADRFVVVKQIAGRWLVIEILPDRFKVGG
ncbi:MAG: hypothetical protein II007_15300 [Gammaproteobacteria bacterium]|nr:hypothetical protein [Gammaproteobacteria bacterium]